MKRIFHLPLIAVMLTVPAALVAAPGPVRDFQLPPAPTPTPSSAPEVQGPVDSDAPISTRPRDIAAPAATPTRTSVPTATPSQPATVQPIPRSTSSPVVQPIPDRREPQQRTAPTRAPSAPTQSQPAQTDSTLDSAEVTATDTENGAELDSPTAPLSSLSDVPESVANAETNTASSLTLPRYFWWVLALVLLMGLSAAMLVWWRRREPSATNVPTIEPPLGKARPAQNVTRESEGDGFSSDAVATPTEPSLPDLPIQITAEASALSRSMMNAALTYRFELLNLGKTALEDISIKADITTAHGKAPVTDQVAQDDTELPFTSFMPMIKAGASQELKGELRMPVSAIRQIPQGNARLYVPLVRLRVEAEGFAPLIHTFVVGIRPEKKGGKLLPFRLDEMAQTYRAICFRAVS